MNRSSAALELTPVYNQIKSEVIKELIRTFGREISIGRASGDVFTGLTFSDVKIARGKTLAEGSVITAKEMTVYYNPLEMARTFDIQAAIYKVEFVEPKVELIRNSKGEINLAELLPQPAPGEKAIPFYPKIEIKNGTCLYTDQRGFGEKNIWWSPCQVKLVVEAQLDPAMSASKRERMLMKTARKIEYIQTRRRTASRSHRKRRLRQLRELGIPISHLRRCFGGNLAL